MSRMAGSFGLLDIDHLLDLAGVVRQVPQVLDEAVGHLLGRGVPVAAHADGQEVAGAAKLLQVLHQAGGSPHHLAVATALQEPELIMDLLRKANQLALG